MTMTESDKEIRVKVVESNISGVVIGSYGGTVGVLLGTGEYIDISEASIQQIS